MKEIFELLIGVVVLILGIPIGNFLAKYTKEELKNIQIYLKILVFLSLIGGFIGLIIKNDILMFSLFFIAIISSRSLKTI